MFSISYGATPQREHRRIYQKYFSQNFANDLICLASLTVPHLNVNTEIAGNVELEIDAQIIVVGVPVLRPRKF